MPNIYCTLAMPDSSFPFPDYLLAFRSDHDRQLYLDAWDSLAQEDKGCLMEASATTMRTFTLRTGFFRKAVYAGEWIYFRKYVITGRAADNSPESAADEEIH